MTSSNKVIIGFCITIVFAAIVIALFFRAQLTVAQNGTNERVGFARVIDEAGWKVPSISTGISKNKREVTRDGVTLIETHYEPKEKTDLVALTYYADEEGNLYQSTKHLELQSFSTFEIAGRILAYRIESLQFGISSAAGRMYFGEKLQFAFIDADGDGKFETREYGDFRSVPSWAKQLK